MQRLFHRRPGLAAVLVVLAGIWTASAVAETVPPADASRFLMQATFGPTQKDIDQVAAQGYAAWIDQQIARPASSHLAAASLGLAADPGLRDHRINAWFGRALHADDQLRQRVAFALSEIFVVSDRSDALAAEVTGVTSYYDILVDGAFGNYRDLLENVTLSPAMGRYLSMLGNQKPDPATGRRADENYAREVMQLFTIGLVKLKPNGEPDLKNGHTQPTYRQTHIEHLARVFTGWYWTMDIGGNPNWRQPMVPIESWHDTDEKTIVRGVTVPAGGTAQQDLEIALDTLFHHPNVGPFIGRQLIQKLVTSNPSPTYVKRVAAAFANNGAGVRGDLGAVVRAVLLDPEARQGRAANPDFGKPREPLLMLTHLWRAFDARALAISFPYPHPEYAFGQAPLSAPSVFNFYSPGYSPVGEIRQAALVAPEFQLANESSRTLALNEFYNRVYFNYRTSSGTLDDRVTIDVTHAAQIASSPAALVDEMDLLLMGGQMPQDLRNALLEHLPKVPLGTGLPRNAGRERALDAIYLTVSSPYFGVQH